MIAGQRIYSVGSLIVVNSRVHMVSGYRLINESGSIGVGYILVPFPLGFIEERSISLCSASTVGPAVFDGHRDLEALELVSALESVANADEDADELDDYYRYMHELLVPNQSEG